MSYLLAIEKVELASSAAQIEFTNIPQDGAHLYITTSFRINRATNDNLLNITYNNNTNAIYDRQTFVANVNFRNATRQTNENKFELDHYIPGTSGGSPNSFFGGGNLWIWNYTKTKSKNAYIGWAAGRTAEISMG